MVLLPSVQNRFLIFCKFFPYLNVICRSHLSISHQYHDRAISTHSNNGLGDFFDLLLQRCIGGVHENLSLERPVKQIHTQTIVTSSLFSAFLSARLISTYAKLSLLHDAKKVFDISPEDCFFSSRFWNSMLRAYVTNFRYECGLELYGKMRELNVSPDGFGFPLIVKACAMKRDDRLCKSVHCHAIQLGFANHLHVGNELVGMYGEIGQTEAALQVFDKMPLRSCVSWNTLISVFAKSCNCDAAFTLFCRMEIEGWEPNFVTWTSLISSFARSGLLDKTWQFYVLMRQKGVDPNAESIAVVVSACNNTPIKGAMVHVNVIKFGFGKYICVRSALISMYGRNGDVKKAEYLFSELEQKSLVSWNALISAYAQSGLCDEAFSAFQRLENLQDEPDVCPNVVSWTAVIDGFAAAGRHGDTLEMFQRMQLARVRANTVTIASVLSVCAMTSALPLGQEIHTHVIRLWMDHDTLVANSLINMYMKCGYLRTGRLIFEETVCRDVNTWNIVITGYGMHGFGNNALEIFHRMVSGGVKPDNVTFVAILSACSHSGLVPEGQAIFNQMKYYQVEPRVEHYACMVDLYGRAGLLQEASNIVRSMPMEPNAPVWGAMLNSCRMHKNEEMAARIFDLEREATGSYMLLSNIYAEKGKWEDAARVRRSLKSQGLKKVAGQSVIEVKKKVQSFSAGQYLDVDMEEVGGIAEELNLQMRRMEV